MIPKLPFGRTGHDSTRTLFGAAALSAMRQEKADSVLELLLEFGVNHIDVAASYGDAELRIAPWMKQHRKDFFLASKTGERTAAGVKESIQRSLERLQVDQIDLIQFHNLTDEEGWQTAMGPGGALEAAIEAQAQGLVRFIGVTGHGISVPDMHLRSLAEFDFDSVLLPYSIMMMQDPEYAAGFEALYLQCREKNIAMQTIKSIARRRWREEDPSLRFSWYEPIKDEDALRRAVHWNFSRPGIFLNTSSDATLLRKILQAASDFDDRVSEAIGSEVEIDVKALDMEPLFVRGVTDSI
ncbi:MAG: aldo/keto reductase [Gammaproteobacteria bacterium]|nr:aldo/keto reductase [Gammaproteobacteria bacterium]